MKYWLYSEGSILGPYAPSELAVLPAFGPGTLVCPESAGGGNPSDWQAAESVPAIAALLSGSARREEFGPAEIALQAVTAGQAYASNSLPGYFEAVETEKNSYENLLDTIDNILGAYKDPAAGAPAKDYDLVDKFDIRLSKIQEELEAARWEKNLLLEKMRLREMEEKKTRDRLADLELQLREAREKLENRDKQLGQVTHLADLKTVSEGLRQLEDIKREDIVTEPPAAGQPDASAAGEAPASQPEAQEEPVKPKKLGRSPGPQGPFKSMQPASYELALEKLLEDEAGGALGAAEDPLSSRKFRSIAPVVHPINEMAPGQALNPPSAGDAGAPYAGEAAAEEAPAPAPEAAPEPSALSGYEPPAEKRFNDISSSARGPVERPLTPLPQQESGLVYDFTVVTPKKDGGPREKLHFSIEPNLEPSPAQAAAEARAPEVSRRQAEPPPPQPVKPPTYDFGIPPKAQPAPQPAPMPEPQAQPSFAPFQPSSPAWEPPVSARPAAAPERPAPAPSEERGDKTVRLPMPPSPAAPAAAPAPRKRSNKFFLATLALFAAMAAGGLGFLFLGDGASIGEMLMLDSGKKRKAADEAEPKAAAQPSGAQASGAAAKAPAAPAQSQASQQQAQQGGPEPIPNEVIKKAIDIVKNYRLSGGRGTVSSWFANSFLSGSAGGSNEEWSATGLHGEIFVVQYRLLRPRQDPLIYQFEVDTAKGVIARGINNNAIELLEASKEKTVSAKPAPAPKKAAPRKPARPRETPILPLPDAPKGGGEEAPSGFENVEDGGEKVKYLMAQESDEELF